VVQADLGMEANSPGIGTVYYFLPDINVTWDSTWKIFRIGTVRYNWPMSAHGSQAFSIAHCTDSEDLPSTPYLFQTIAAIFPWTGTGTQYSPDYTHGSDCPVNDLGLPPTGRHTADITQKLQE